MLDHTQQYAEEAAGREVRMIQVRQPGYVRTRRFAPRAAYAARYARSGRKNTLNYAERTEVHDLM